MVRRLARRATGRLGWNAVVLFGVTRCSVPRGEQCRRWRVYAHGNLGGGACRNGTLEHRHGRAAENTCLEVVAGYWHALLMQLPLQHWEPATHCRPGLRQHLVFMQLKLGQQSELLLQLAPVSLQHPTVLQY